MYTSSFFFCERFLCKRILTVSDTLDEYLEMSELYSILWLSTQFMFAVTQRSTLEIDSKYKLQILMLKMDLRLSLFLLFIFMNHFKTMFQFLFIIWSLYECILSDVQFCTTYMCSNYIVANSVVYWAVYPLSMLYLLIYEFVLVQCSVLTRCLASRASDFLNIKMI